MFMLISSCRLCRSYENINTTLHHIDSDNLSFYQKLCRIAQGILENNPNLPNGICTNCITELNIANKFINKCSESQTIFQRYLELLQHGQHVQPDNNQEIQIQVIKLEELSCNNSEVKPNNSVSVKHEKETEFFNEDNNDAAFESNQVNFEDDIKIEEHDIEHILENLEQENIDNNYSLTLSDEMAYVDDEDGGAFSTVRSEVNSNNCINVKHEKETEFVNEESNLADFDSNQITFEDYTKIEENDEIRNILAQLKTEDNDNNNSLTPCEELDREYDKNDSEFASVRDHSDLINLNKKETEFVNEESNLADFDSNQITFEDYTKIEENDEIRNILAQLKTENIDNNYYYDDVTESSSARDHGDSININNEYGITEVKDVKIEEDNLETDIVDLPEDSGHFTGFDFTECNVANRYKLKYHLKLERLAKVINKEHKKNVNKVLKRSEIGKNSSNVNINIQAPYKCKIYNKPRNRRLNLTRPKRTRTDKKLDKPYQCVICGRATVSKYDLKKHIRIHTKEKPFKCETCNMAFNQSSNLKTHIRIHTNDKPFKCETCNMAFNQSSSLKQHIRIHTNEKSFKCETCSTSFNNPSNLKRHIRIHTNDKPFKCELCNKAFTHSSNLKRHIRIHTNDKPFKCELCNKAFTQSSNLKQHIRIHTNDKPFKCELCNKAFTQSSTLKQHIRIHANKKQ